MTATAPRTVPPGDRPLSDPTAAQRRHVLVVGAALLVSTVLAVLAALTNPAADDAASRLIHGWTWLDGLTWLTIATEPAFVVAAAALVLLGVRCRAFLLTAAGTLLVAVVLGRLLAVVVARERPIESALTGDDSFPSVGVLVLTVVAGLVPTALEIATGSRTARRLSTAVLSVLVLGACLAEVYQGDRWLFDVVAGVVIGVGLVAASRALLEQPAWHRSCRDCPWSRRALETDQVGPFVMTVDPASARRFYPLALMWALGIVVVYGVMALWGGLPRSPESGVMGTGLEIPLQWALLLLMIVGVLLAWRWHVVGAIVVAFAAAMLGYASSVQYPAPIAIVIAIIAWVPALLLWLEWHRRTTLRAALAAAVVTSIVLGGVIAAAAVTYSNYWGPTHPRSATAAPSTEVVTWMWVGGVTSTSGDIRLRTADEAGEVSILVSEQPDLSNAVASTGVRPDEDRVANVRLDGLRPGVRYYYAAQVDEQVVRDRVQTFRTFPDGVASFSFVLGSCQIGGSNGQVFDAMRDLDPLFVLAMGDWTYGNIDRDDPGRFRAQYDLNLTAPAQAALYAQASIAYVWGDHDYGGNDADRTSPSRAAAMRTYRQMTPHYPLESGAEGPIYQAFTVGRVRFVMTDTRSARDPVGMPSGEFRSTLGEEQREWLLDELTRADRYGLVVWVNPDPWLAAASPASDTWGGFAEERELIADAIAENEVDNLLMVSGDAHMLAFDDGSHTDYSSSGTGGFPLFHAAAVDRPGSVKGGPYSGQVLPGGGQFGTVEVRDDGTVVEVTVTGWDWASQRLFSDVVRFPPPVNGTR